MICPKVAGWPSHLKRRSLSTLFLQCSNLLHSLERTKEHRLLLSSPMPGHQKGDPGMQPRLVLVPGKLLRPLLKCCTNIVDHGKWPL